MIGLFSIFNKYYFGISNLQSILSNAAFKGVVVIGQLMVVLAGGFDLSVGAVVGVSTLFCLALNILTNLPLPVIILIIICGGAIFGLINGVLIKIVGINPIITTLGTSFIISSLGYLYQNNFLNLSERPRIESTSFAQITDGFVGIIPKIFIYPLVFFIIAIIILRFTSFGRSLFVVGANTKIAQILGFNVRRIQIITYVVSGACAAIGGLLLSSQLLTGRPSLGADCTLDVLIIVILGGTLIGGGKTDIIGVFLTLLLLESLENGLVMVDISYFLRQTFTGILLIIAIAVNSARARELNL
jgi:erythritol transport system permease protein